MLLGLCLHFGRLLLIISRLGIAGFEKTITSNCSDLYNMCWQEYCCPWKQPRKEFITYSICLTQVHSGCEWLIHFVASICTWNDNFDITGMMLSWQRQYFLLVAFLQVTGADMNTQGTPLTLFNLQSTKSLNCILRVELSDNIR